MGKIVLSVIGSVIFLFIFTNPSKKKHQEAVMSKINSSKYTSMVDWGRSVHALGGMYGDVLVGDLVSVENSFFFSVTKLTTDIISRELQERVCWES